MSAAVRRMAGRALAAAAGVAALFLLVAPFGPRLARAAAAGTLGGLGELLWILPPVLLLIALIDAWVPRRLVEARLGPGSGFQGPLLALLLGTAAAGPIYAAFPVALALRAKGARTANLVIFLGAWAAIKIPMLMLESAYLGPRFALLRLGLTLPGVFAAGFLMEKVVPVESSVP